MANTIKKEMTVGECYRIVLWYEAQLQKIENNEPSIIKKLSNLLQWKLRRNVATIQNTAIEFEKYRESVRKEFNDTWLTEEKTERISNGSEKEDIKIKDEYLEDYKEAVKELTEMTKNILNEKSEYPIFVMDVEGELEKALNDMENPNFNEIEILLFMNETTN